MRDGADIPGTVNDDRSFLAFLVAIRTYPGFRTRVAVAACFMAVLARQSGVQTALLTVAGALGLALAIGYPMWRRLGTRATR